jgi:hypothetical protein
VTSEICGRRVYAEFASIGPAGPDWFDIWPTENGAPWVRAQRTLRGYRIRYEGRADFVVDVDSRSIACDPVNCPDTMLRHFLMDQVVPLMLSVEHVVLHASSVVLNGGFTAFVGPGGAGKSTIALALGRAGFAIGSDDALLIETESGSRTPGLPWLATPAYPSLRVWQDSAAVAATAASNADEPPSAKRQFRDGFSFFTEPLPLVRLYALDPEPSASTRFEPLSPREAVMTLVEQSYRLALDDRASLARQLDALSGIARDIPAWRLSCPRRLDAWRDLAAAVAAHAEGTASEVV